MSPVRVFCSYAREDKDYLLALVKHLAALQRENRIVIWYDEEIEAGKEWSKEVEHQMQQSAVFIFLISADFIASEYCYDIELSHALSRVQNESARIIPVLIRDTDWQNTIFGRYQVLPPGGISVSAWEDSDKAWHLVVSNIRKVIDSMTAEWKVIRTLNTQSNQGRTTDHVDLPVNVMPINPGRVSANELLKSLNQLEIMFSGNRGLLPAPIKLKRAHELLNSMDAKLVELGDILRVSSKQGVDNDYLQILKAFDDCDEMLKQEVTERDIYNKTRILTEKISTLLEKMR